MSLVSPNFGGPADGFDLAVFLHASGGLHQLPGVEGLRVTVPHGGIPAIEFTVPKSIERIHAMQHQFEVSVRVWHRWKRDWVEPPNCRFYCTGVREDPTDITGKVTFRGAGVMDLLRGVKIHKGKHDTRLVAREKTAEQAWKTAESEHASRKKAVANKVRQVRDRRKLRGGIYYSTAYPKTATKDSVLYNRTRNKFYRWDAPTKKWRLLVEPTQTLTDTKNAWDSWQTYRPTMIRALNVYKRAMAAAVEATKSGKRPLINATPGHLVTLHWNEANRRGNRTVSKLVRSFNAGLQTGKKKWSARRDWEADIGSSLLQLVETLVEAGAVEYRARGRIIDLAEPGRFRVDQSKRVHLRYVLDIEAGDADTDYTQHAAYTLVRGDADATWAVRDMVPATGWGVWEQSITVSGAKTRSQAVVMSRGQRRQSVKRALTDDLFDLTMSPGRPKPLVDYLPGHMIMVDTPAGASRMVVREVTITRDNDGKLAGSIIVGWARKATIQLGRNIVKGIDGATAQIGMRGAVPDIDPGWPEQLTSTAPESPVADATVAADPVTGRYTVNLEVGWSDPATTELAGEDEEDDLVDETTPEP